MSVLSLGTKRSSTSLAVASSLDMSSVRIRTIFVPAVIVAIVLTRTPGDSPQSLGLVQGAMTFTLLAAIA